MTPPSTAPDPFAQHVATPAPVQRWYLDNQKSADNWFSVVWWPSRLLLIVDLGAPGMIHSESLGVLRAGGEWGGI